MPALREGSGPAAGLSGDLAPFGQGLWGQAIQLESQPSAAPDSLPARPVLSGYLTDETPTLHLPASLRDGLAPAALAHAAAHWRFGGAPIARAGLKPIQQALVEVLEDARIETLALAELPGLRRLWLPWHAGELGQGFEALLGRLARALLDPTVDEPHPWIAKARLACLDGNGVFLPQNVAEVRALASGLGNDIGQMRLPFNPRTYRPHAAYRDDGSWLWQPVAQDPPSDLTLSAAGGQGRQADPTPGSDAQVEREATATPGAAGEPDSHEPLASPTTVFYPEWDWRLGRYRPQWCQVQEPVLPQATSQDGAPLPVIPQARRQLARALQQLQGIVQRSGGRASDGDEFHPVALVEARLDQQARRSPDTSLYRRLARPAPPLAVLVLLDVSASTAAAGNDGQRLLDSLRTAAHTAVAALQAQGHRCALAAFASYGRQRVEVTWIKPWQMAADAPPVLARLTALRSGGSTRLGTVLRHATACSWVDARAAPGWQRHVVLVTDGEPHDIDVYDQGEYLAADLRRAGAEAAAQGVAASALVLAPGDRRVLAAALGEGACVGLAQPGELAAGVLRVLGR